MRKLFFILLICNMLFVNAQSLELENCRSADRHITLLPAALGDNAGFIGAAALILK